jgi:hypothetical protein
LLKVASDLMNVGRGMIKESDALVVLTGVGEDVYKPFKGERLRQTLVAGVAYGVVLQVVGKLTDLGVMRR